MRNVVSNSILLFAVLVLACIWIAGAPKYTARAIASGMSAPFFRLCHGARERILLAGQALFTRDPQEHMRELEAKARRFQVGAAEAQRLRQQNAALRAFHGLPKRAGWRPVIAEIIARDPVTWNRSFRINRGSRDGLVPGAIVLADEFVVGRVDEVQPGSASVIMIGARACRLSVQLEGSSATGILTGTGADGWRQRPRCIVDFLPPDITVKPGDFVWTSGLGEAVPVGLIVGRIAASDNEQKPLLERVEGVRARVRVESLAPVENLLFVAVYCAGGR